MSSQGAACLSHQYHRRFGRVRSDKAAPRDPGGQIDKGDG